MEKLKRARKSTIPPGALLIPEFISEDEHDELVKFFDGKSWQEPDDTGIHRRTQQYGYDFAYHDNGDYKFKGKGIGENKIGELPPLLKKFSDRALE